MISNRRIVLVWCLALMLAAGFMFGGKAGAQTKTPSKFQAHTSQLGKLDLNKANAEQLAQYPGITQATAKAIEEYRRKSGPFKAPEDLLKVKGVTKELLNRLKVEKGILYLIPAAPPDDIDEEEPSLKPSKC